MYEIPLKTSQKPHVGERTGKRYISCVTARPIRVMWQSRRAAKSTQSQREKRQKKQKAKN